MRENPADTNAGETPGRDEAVGTSAWVKSPEPSRTGLDPVESGRPASAPSGVSDLGRDSHVWFGFALVAGVVVSTIYLLTHQYPAYGAGLYLEVASQIRAHEYTLPATVPYYTDGIPLAYPPLQFFVVAVLTDIGISGMTVSRYLPALVTVLYLVPYYGIAERLLPTRRQAGVATIIFAVTPPVLQWHLSAGGIVRASAFLLALCGIYAGTRIFVDEAWRWTSFGAVCFALTILSHPVYTVFFGVSWLVLFAAFDRSVRGLLGGALVAVGGVVMSAPWWWEVASRHGWSVFTSAAGSHSGIAGGVGRLLDQFVYPFDPTIVTIFFVASFAAAAVLVARKQYVLPMWLVVLAYTLGKERFQFVPGAMMISTVLFGVVVPRVSEELRGTLDTRQSMAVVATVVIVLVTAIGGFYAGSALGSAHHGSPSLPPFMDDDDREAMQWAEANTAPNATFVVLSDAAEWFPYYTDRSILVGPWGAEWESPEQYYDQLSAFKNSSTCENASCVSRSMASVGAEPDYLYVPRGAYTVRGIEEDGIARLHASLEESPGYVQLYHNDGVVVYRVTSAAVTDTETNTPNASQIRNESLSVVVNKTSMTLSSEPQVEPWHARTTAVRSTTPSRRTAS
ncbi:ArnT family glycosyltransferase [Haloferax sp. YSSS75]|uniref:ArnT family glycosyltransferase n=1 Tax=Haloferax sp. YSSS75 TaxID=3388564 RepID=UPI00398D1E59